MIKTYKIRVFTKDVDIDKFNINCGIKKFIYNLFITVNKDRYRNNESFMNYMFFEKWLNHEFLPNNPEYQWIKKASQKNLKQGMKDANDAFKRFFKKEADFPRYKRKRDKVSFYFVNDNHIKIERHRVKIPIFGWLRLKEFGYLPKGKILSGNLVREANMFYVCLKSEEEIDVKELGEQTEGIGNDLGIENLVTVSDGRVFENINKTSKIKLLENRKNHLQKELSRRLGKKLNKKEQEETRKEREDYKKWWKSLSKEEKTEIKEQKKELYSFENKKLKRKEEANKKVSKNAIKTIQALQTVYAKLSRMRQEYVRQVVNSLVKPNPQFIAIEDLNIRGLVKNKYLSKAILSCCWGYFIEYLTRQCEKYDIKLIKADRFYPSSKTCSNCGCKKIKLSLSERTFKCLNCGNEIDRDLNASLNLKYLGLTGEFAVGVPTATA